LEIEFEIVKKVFNFDIEEIVNDFILICFLVGNDFLPHSPSMDIKCDAIGVFFLTYKIFLSEKKKVI